MKHIDSPISLTPPTLIRTLVASLGMIFLLVSNAYAQCSTCTVQITTNTRNLNIDEGTTVCIAEGVTITGNIIWNKAATICNSGTIDANFDIPGDGVLYNNPTGTINLSNLNLNQSGGRLINNGDLTITGNVNINRGSELYNGPNTNTSLGGLNLNNGGTITNYGILTSTQDAGISGNITNAIGATFTITGSVNINSGAQLNNLGTFIASNVINSATISNCGTFRQSVAGGSFTNNSNVSNFGTFNIAGSFTNNGIFDGATQGGVGVVLVGRDSRQNGSGSFAPTGRLNFCKGFDTDNGKTNSANVTCSTSLVTAGCANSPLPVELTSFTAKLSKGSVLLSWTTASEKDNEKFVVERSADGEAYSVLKEVAGHGTSSAGYSYSATDLAPLAGTSYYRLRQVDFDGSVNFSPVVTIQNDGANLANKLNIYPNPATDHITLDLPKNAGETCEVRISTVNGKLMRSLTLDASAPQVDVQSLPAGTYILQVQSANTKTVQRLVKQ